MLKKIKPEVLDVLSTFLERKKALPIYNKIVNTISGTPIYETLDTKDKIDSYLYCIYDFPGYLKGYVTKKGWKLKIINTYKGSLILLKNYINTEDYLKHKFSAGRRSKFRTYQKRLETCFNIEYKTYFGNISKDEYESLFKAFHDMTRKRFLEKKIQNYDLSRWDVYQEIAYPLINSKEAVLFVILSDNKPISICLNFIRQKTIYGYLRAFDVDYSKFYIGFTDFIKQLHWCFENGIEVFDLLKGSYPYKMRLIDTQYNFQKHILYNSNSFSTTVSANVITGKTQAFYTLVKVLKKLNVNKLYYKFINYKYRNKELQGFKNEYENIVLINNFKIEPNEVITELNLNNDSLSFLKRFVFNFLYSNQESINNVKLFRYNKETNSYIIKGQKNTQKITLQRAPHV
ncbi:GNAT family N-acetyltransferase [Flavivirga rizhaonensis]|uniref:GNAT family N-acetyltransferase n=1 Tax=Flavivirga rizhaonensis TaxID=2559571 RepID=A0A4S1E0B5_9FLAO|nr:GNAT family N-acetyltransferase [Flavivirga rizhaonensis]TGV03940.1 GNAT family N-acetyltransferase [Flavivirga rizhaonensis]